MTTHSLAQPFVQFVFGFALSHLARIPIIIILYDSCLLPAEFCDKIIHVPFGYKNQSVNAVQWNNRCLFWDPHETHDCNVWTERRIFLMLKTWWYIKKPLDFRGLIFVSDLVRNTHFILCVSHVTSNNSWISYKWSLFQADSDWWNKVKFP